MTDLSTGKLRLVANPFGQTHTEAGVGSQPDLEIPLDHVHMVRRGPMQSWMSVSYWDEQSSGYEVATVTTDLSSFVAGLLALSPTPDFGFRDSTLSGLDSGQPWA